MPQLDAYATALAPNKQWDSDVRSLPLPIFDPFYRASLLRSLLRGAPEGGSDTPTSITALVGTLDQQVNLQLSWVERPGVSSEATIRGNATLSKGATFSFLLGLSLQQPKDQGTKPFDPSAIDTVEIQQFMTEETSLSIGYVDAVISAAALRNAQRQSQREFHQKLLSQGERLASGLSDAVFAERP